MANKVLLNWTLKRENELNIFFHKSQCPLKTHPKALLKFTNFNLHFLRQINTFVHLGFSSSITSDTVALTNFIKNFHFCGRLYFDSLVA